MTDAVTIHIPTPLRPHVGNHESVAVIGASVRLVLGALAAQFPELGKRLYKSESEINRFINVYINDEDIRYFENLDTKVKPSDELSIVMANTGG